MNGFLRAAAWAAAVAVAAGCASGKSKVAPPPAEPAEVAAAARVAVHPLDPLTSEEMARAVDALMSAGKYAEGMFLPTLVLHEPSKEAVRAFRPGGTLKREAFAVVLDRKANATSEAVIDLSTKSIKSWTPRPGAQPAVLMEEFEHVPEIVRADPTWQAAMKKRGIEDVKQVLIDTWAAGVMPVKGAKPGARLARAIAFHYGTSGNAYGRPVEGVVAIVDMNEGKVVEVVDTGVRPLAKAVQDLDAASLPKSRGGLKKLSVEQPDGPSYEIDGHLVRWQKWQFRFAMHPREGLVLYTVGYEDGGKVRPILHRASIAEMVVPYGDPDSTWAWRAAFDEGEYGLGKNANELEAGLDAPDHATFVEAMMADEAGKPETWKNAVAFYERDGGILWKHFDEAAEKSFTRRARQLVVMQAVTVGNYDYFIHWIFHQDGTLEMRAEASGILLAKGVAQATCQSCAAAEAGKPAEGDERTGTLVAERIVAPNHQHFFSFRLDFDVDGEANSVAEVNVSALPPGEGNPWRNGFAMDKTPLATELAARRDLNAATHRHWKVYNAGAKTALGHPAGYLLSPGENSGGFMAADSASRLRAAFVNHHLWVTAYKPDEMFASGSYPNLNSASEGLPQWVKDDESLVNRDLVVWYTAGLTHVPRPEEWPVMPVAGVGFKLLPAGFFTRNPGLDVPEK